MLECISDNAYKIDLPGEYGVSGTFNVANLSLYDFNVGADSRMNHSEEGGNDAITSSQSKKANHSSDVLLHFDGPMTKSRAKMFKNALSSFVYSIINKVV